MQLRWPLLLMLVGGKTNIIRRLLRICTMSTSTVGWCNNCSFSAKKMHFGAKRDVLRGGAMGWVAAQWWGAARSVSSRLGSNGDGSLRSDSNVIWPPCPVLLCTAVEVWCDMTAGIAVSSRKYGLGAPSAAYTPHNASERPFRFQKMWNAGPPCPCPPCSCPPCPCPPCSCPPCPCPPCPLHAPQCFQESIYISENVECWWCDGGDLPPRSLIEIPKAVPGHSSLTPPEISEKIPKISKQISKL